MAKTIDVAQLPSEVAAALIDRKEAVIVEQAGREVGVFVPIRRLPREQPCAEPTEEEIEADLLREIQRYRAEQALRAVMDAVAADNPHVTEEEVETDVAYALRAIRAGEAGQP